MPVRCDFGKQRKIGGKWAGFSRLLSLAKMAWMQMLEEKEKQVPLVSSLHGS
jgi:hypothetical protein